MKRTPDLSHTAFLRALKRNGFKLVLMWVSDTTGQVPGMSWGCIYWASGPKKGKMARRATLAKVVRERDKEIARKARDAAAKADLDRILASCSFDARSSAAR